MDIAVEKAEDAVEKTIEKVRDQRLDTSRRRVQLPNFIMFDGTFRPATEALCARKEMKIERMDGCVTHIKEGQS